MIAWLKRYRERRADMIPLSAAVQILSDRLQAHDARITRLERRQDPNHHNPETEPGDRYVTGEDPSDRPA